MDFKNPENGNIHSTSGATGVLAFFFNPVYFLVKGAYGAAGMHFLLCHLGIYIGVLGGAAIAGNANGNPIQIGIGTLIFIFPFAAHFYYAWNARRIVTNAYLKRGYQQVS